MRLTLWATATWPTADVLLAHQRLGIADARRAGGWSNGCGRCPPCPGAGCRIDFVKTSPTRPMPVWAAELFAVGHGDSGGLLPAVLLGVEAGVDAGRAVGRAPNAEDAALVFHVSVHGCSVRIARFAAAVTAKPRRSATRLRLVGAGSSIRDDRLAWKTIIARGHRSAGLLGASRRNEFPDSGRRSPPQSTGPRGCRGWTCGPSARTASP